MISLEKKPKRDTVEQDQQKPSAGTLPEPYDALMRDIIKSGDRAMEQMIEEAKLKPKQK